MDCERLTSTTYPSNQIPSIEELFGLKAARFLADTFI